MYKSTEVKIYSVNIYSLMAKRGMRLRDLTAQVAKFQPHAVLVQETWLNASKPDSKVAIPGYTIYRHDRDDRRGGGVAIYVRKDLSIVGGPFRANYIYNGLPPIEAITVDVEIHGRVFSLTSTYRPPEQTKAAIEAFSYQLRYHCENHSAGYRVVAGDLNCCLNHYNAKRPVEILPSLTLFSLGLQPTVFIPTHKKRIIDQIYIPKSAELMESLLDDPIEREHHAIFVHFRVTDNDSSVSDRQWVDFRSESNRFEYREVVRNGINQHPSHNWKEKTSAQVDHRLDRLFGNMSMY